MAKFQFRVSATTKRVKTNAPCIRCVSENPGKNHDLKAAKHDVIQGLTEKSLRPMTGDSLKSK